MHAALLLSFGMLFDSSNAFHVPLQGRRAVSRGLGKREHPVSLVNFADVTYFTNLTLGGMTFSLAIDTARQVFYMTCFPICIEPFSCSAPTSLLLLPVLKGRSSQGSTPAIPLPSTMCSDPSVVCWPALSQGPSRMPVGAVKTATLDFAGFEVKDQAYGW